VGGWSTGRRIEGERWVRGKSVEESCVCNM
jgi:hypothetical protein